MSIISMASDRIGCLQSDNWLMFKIRIRSDPKFSNLFQSDPIRNQYFRSEVRTNPIGSDSDRICTPLLARELASQKNDKQSNRREVRLAPVHMILLAEISRLVGRIFPCIHIRHFILLAEMNSKLFLLAPAKRVNFNHAA